MNKILITGITGFVGSHLAENLVKNNFKVFGLKRSNSNIWRCEEFKEKIIWVNIDDKENCQKILFEVGIDVLVHCAWIGVESNERNLWDLQSKNLSFLFELLQISKKAHVKKILILGSQSEYGQFEGKISENHIPNPTNAYAAIKLACLELAKNFANINEINWVWIRAFSLFGEKEGDNWLIPSTLNSIKNNSKLMLTLGEQKYAYLYVKDLTEIIFRMIEKNIDSGIYNVSSKNPLSIRTIVTLIKNKVDPFFKLKFGTLEYRENQSMHIEGDIKKLEAQLGKIHFTDFEFAIEKTINFYLKKK